MENQQQWVIEQLQHLATGDNQVVMQAAIELIQSQQDEIDSLHGAMEGQLWSPNQWRK